MDSAEQNPQSSVAADYSMPANAPEGGSATVHEFSRERWPSEVFDLTAESVGHASNEMRPNS
jgi:hypothetical protein